MPTMFNRKSLSFFFFIFTCFCMSVFKIDRVWHLPRLHNKSSTSVYIHIRYPDFPQVLIFLIWSTTHIIACTSTFMRGFISTSRMAFHRAIHKLSTRWSIYDTRLYLSRRFQEQDIHNSVESLETIIGDRYSITWSFITTEDESFLSLFINKPIWCLCCLVRLNSRWQRWFSTQYATI